MPTSYPGLYLIADGPLKGEWHNHHRPTWRFDGHLIDLPDGTYHLRDGVYRWEPDRDVIKMDQSERTSP